MSTTQYLFAGFGGQGILFAGKFAAYKGLIEEKQVSWLPSYGPEMRGGTASCSVIISDSPVGSPIVSKPDVLIAMNLPSLDRYEAPWQRAAQYLLTPRLLTQGKTHRCNGVLCARNPPCKRKRNTHPCKYDTYGQYFKGYGRI